MTITFSQAYREIGVAHGLPPEQEQVFAAWHALLVQWNTRINLTRIVAPAEAVTRHLLDCLPLARCLADGSSLLDIGSGAGVPGLVVAALRSAVRVTCAESVQKKAAFLRQAVAAMGLTNVVVAAQRAEQLTERFAVATARAVAAPAELITRYAHLLLPAGEMAFFLTEDETPEIVPPFNVRHSLDYRLPGVLSPRRLVVAACGAGRDFPSVK